MRLALAALLTASTLAAIYVFAPTLQPLQGTELYPTASTGQTLEFELGPSRESERRAVYIPSAGSVSAIELGSRDIPLKDVRGASGFSFTSASYLLPLPTTEGVATTAFRIRFAEDHGRIGISRVFLAPSNVAERAALSQRNWAWRNQIISMIIAVLAALVFTLLIGGVSPQFSPSVMAALAYIVLAQALLRERDISLFFGHLAGGGEYFLAIWAAFAVALAPKINGHSMHFGRLLLILFLLSNLLVLLKSFLPPPLSYWLPAVLWSPVLALGAIRLWHAAKDPAFPSLNLAAYSLALVTAAVSLGRAADPSLFNEAFALTTLHSLGTLPLLATGMVALVYHSFENWRIGVAKLKADYAAQSAELGRVGALLQEESHRRMLFEERSRITRDMHDGIGGRLLSLLVRVRAGRLDITDVEREVQESLNDLRLIVDSLDSAGESLDAALSAFRSRAERQIAGAAMILEWTEDTDSLEGVSLEPQATLDILRVMQEAVSNAINHSGAGKVSISIAREGGSLNISIADNGHGLGPEAGTGRGKGLKNMRTRALRLGAKLEMTSNGGTGTRVSIRKPLARLDHSSGGSLSQPN